jgi:hypothetical protein
VANFQADFLGVNGIFDGTVTFPAGVVNETSYVLASICEVGEGDQEDYNPGDPNDDFVPFNVPMKGAAVFTLHNIVPFHDGHVEITIDTGWSATLLNVRMNFVVDPA